MLRRFIRSISRPSPLQLGACTSAPPGPIAAGQECSSRHHTLCLSDYCEAETNLLTVLQDQSRSHASSRPSSRSSPLRTILRLLLFPECLWWFPSLHLCFSLNLYLLRLYLAGDKDQARRWSAWKRFCNDSGGSRHKRRLSCQTCSRSHVGSCEMSLTDSIPSAHRTSPLPQ